MPPQVTEAICLSVQTYSETSKIAVLYTRKWGRLSVIAKGAKRPKSQFIGHLEPLSIAECVIYFKPKDRLQLLSSCRAVRPWMGLTRSLARAGYAFAVTEFLYRHTHEEADAGVYGLVRATLEAMDRLPEPLLERQFWGYILSVLGQMGFQPELSGCERCGRTPESDQRVVFDAAAGKIICRHCRGERHEQGRIHILSHAAMTELLKRQAEPILTDDEPPLSRAALDQSIGAIEDFARFHLGWTKLRSLDLVRFADIAE